MKMKRVNAVILSAALIVGLMTGCGSTDKAEDTKAEISTEQTPASVETPAASSEVPATEESSVKTIDPCEITFWHAMSGQQETTLTELTDTFNNNNEYGITVTLVNQGYYSDLSTKLTANAAADTLPDMTQAYNSWLTAYTDKIIPLDDFVADDFDDYEDIIESYRNECSQFGFISALPFNKSTYVYFYNKTLFDELGLAAPETWEDMKKIGETLKNEKDMVSVGFDDLSGALEAAVHQNGTDFFSKEGALFDNEQGKEALGYLLDLYANGYARLVGEDGYFSGVLSNQLIGAYIGSSTGVSYIDTSTGWELGVAALPGNTEKAANQAGTNLVMFAKDENKQKAVWEYMKYLTSVDSTVKWAMETGYLPVRNSAYESDTYQEFMKNDPTATAAYSQADAFFTQPTFEGSYDMMAVINTKLEEFILSGTDAEAALSELVEEINAQVQ